MFLTRMKQWHEEGSAAAEITLEQLQQLECDTMLKRKAKQIERDEVLGRRASHAQIFEHSDLVAQILTTEERESRSKGGAAGARGPGWLNDMLWPRAPRFFLCGFDFCTPVV